MCLTEGNLTWHFCDPGIIYCETNVKTHNNLV